MKLFIVAELGSDGKWWAVDDRCRSVHETNQTLRFLRLNRDGTFKAVPVAEDLRPEESDAQR